MRILPVVKPTSEQLQLLLDTKPGVFIIKGAAGSGKTTTALMRLRHLCAWWLKRGDGWVWSVLSECLSSPTTELCRATSRRNSEVVTLATLATENQTPDPSRGLLPCHDSRSAQLCCSQRVRVLKGTPLGGCRPSGR